MFNSNDHFVRISRQNRYVPFDRIRIQKNGGGFLGVQLTGLIRPLLRLFQARPCISFGLCRGHFCVPLFYVRGGRIVPSLLFYVRGGRIVLSVILCERWQNRVITVILCERWKNRAITVILCERWHNRAINYFM